MKFEMIIPTMQDQPADELVKRYISALESARKTGRTDIAELYVSSGPALPPFELVLDNIAGKVIGIPEKDSDGKWKIDVDLLDTAAGSTVNTMVPHLEKEGQPMKVMLNGYTDGHIVMGPWSLYFTNQDIFQPPRG